MMEDASPAPVGVPDEPGRESAEKNNLFFVCGLIEYMARKTKNCSSDIVSQLGDDVLRNLYEFADTYHCENIDDVAQRFIDCARIERGQFNNVAACRYAVPTYWDTGKVFKRPVLGVARHDGVDAIEVLHRSYASFVADLIEDYNSAFYYDAPQNILNAYVYGGLSTRSSDSPASWDCWPVMQPRATPLFF